MLGKEVIKLSAIGFTMKRPIWVTIIAISFASYAVMVCLAIAWAFAHPENVQAWTDMKNDTSRVAFEVAFFAPIRMIMAALVAHGLWGMKEWARKGALFCISVVVIMQLARTRGIHHDGLESELFQNAVANYISLALLLVIGAYLASQRVQGQFSSTDSQVG